MEKIPDSFSFSPKKGEEGDRSPEGGSFLRIERLAGLRRIDRISEAEWEGRLEKIHDLLGNVIEQVVIQVVRPRNEKRPVSWEWARGVVTQIAGRAVGDRRRALDNEQTRPRALAEIDLAVRLIAKSIEDLNVDPGDTKKITALRQNGWGIESSFSLLQVALGYIQEGNLFPSESVNFLSPVISEEVRQTIARAYGTKDEYQSRSADALRRIEQQYVSKSSGAAEAPVPEFDLDALAEARTDYLVRFPIEFAKKVGALENVIPKEREGEETVRGLRISALVELRGIIGHRQFIRDYEKAFLNSASDPAPYLPKYQNIWCNPHLLKQKLQKDYGLSLEAIQSKHKREIDNSSENSKYIGYAIENLKEEQGNLASIERTLETALSSLKKEEKDRLIGKFGAERLGMPTLQVFPRTNEGIPQADHDTWKYHFGHLTEKWGQIPLIYWEHSSVVEHGPEVKDAGRRKCAGVEKPAPRPEGIKQGFYEPPRQYSASQPRERVIKPSSKSDQEQRRRARELGAFWKEIKTLESSVKGYTNGFVWKILKPLGIRDKKRELQVQELERLRKKHAEKKEAYEKEYIASPAPASEQEQEEENALPAEEKEREETN